MASAGSLATADFGSTTLAYDFTSVRLFVADPLGTGGRIAADAKAANYLINVLRMPVGATLLVFNGRDGEWRAEIAEATRRSCVLIVAERMRMQPPTPDLDVLFAPLKHARLDYLVQKLTEMGAGRIRPVFTEHTQVTRINLDRMRANVIEAAEQCGVLAVPAVEAPTTLAAALDGRDAARRLIFCDEAAEPASPAGPLGRLPRGPLALLIGPEGGFSAAERSRLRDQPYVVPVSLGPRILRADTAAVAALAVVQATLGDWN